MGCFGSKKAPPPVIEERKDPLLTPALPKALDGYKSEHGILPMTGFVPTPAPNGLRYMGRGPGVNGKITALLDSGHAFRIVDKSDPKKEKWYLYNDSDDRVLRTEYKFDQYSKVVPVGGTMKMESDQPGWTKFVAKIKPGHTEPFIEGRVSGFGGDVVMEEGFATPVPKFDEDGPSGIADKDKYPLAYDALIKEGGAYRIRQDLSGSDPRLDGWQRWYMYNDTFDMVLTVDYEFGPKSEIRPLGDARWNGLTMHEWQKLTMRIEPGETVPFLEGRVIGNRGSFELEDVRTAGAKEVKNSVPYIPAHSRGSDDEYGRPKPLPAVAVAVKQPTPRPVMPSGPPPPPQVNPMQYLDLGGINSGGEMRNGGKGDALGRVAESNPFNTAIVRKRL